MKRGAVLVLSFLFLFIAPPSACAATPSDIDSRMYYPGSDDYPIEYYWKYVEKYTKIVVKPITMERNGETLTLGQVVMTITPLFNHKDRDGTLHYFIDDDIRIFFINIIVYYDAGNYYQNRPCVQYLNYLNTGAAIPDINAFWINTVQVEADLSSFTENDEWGITADWSGEAYSYYAGKWVRNGGTPEGDTIYDILLDKSEKCQYVATDVNYIPDSYQAWKSWKNAYVSRWMGDQNYSNQISNASRVQRTTSWLGDKCHKHTSFNVLYEQYNGFQGHSISDR